MNTSDQPVLPVLPGVEHADAVVGGVRIRYAQAGTGRPVVLLHTFPQNSYAWRRVIPLLAEEFRVICPDLRGAGESDAPAGGYGTAERAADVLGLLDALGLERAILVGHGWGAWAGFRVCLDAPERVEGYVSLGMTHPWPPFGAAARNAWRQWHTAFWEYPVLGSRVLRHWPSFTRFVLRHWAGDASALSREDVHAYAEAVREAPRARAGQRLHWGYVVHDIPKLLFGGRSEARLTVPTRILIGARDAVVRPSMARDAASRCDDLEVRTVPGAGHLLPEERPEAVADAVRTLAHRARNE